MATDPFDSFNDKPPEPVVQVDETTTTPDDNSGVQADGTTIAAEVTPQTDTPPPVVETPPDTFFETLNTRYKTQFKSDDELKPLFELPKKVTQYEDELKGKADLEKKVLQYEKDLDDLKRTEAERYFSTPLMKKAFVADQLVTKHPDKDANLLTELAMADTTKMSDIDILTKERKVNYPNRSLETIKTAILSELGIDPTTPPEEWDSVAVARLEMKADDARLNIKNLTTGIELPRVETPEEKQSRTEAELSKRIEQSAPYRADYSKFDTFKIDEDLEYTVPDDFKAQLGDMFDAFVNAGNELTPENIQIIKGLRDATFFDSHKKDILAAMRKDVETKYKAEQEAELGNTVLPNTATAQDGAGKVTNLPGHSQFVQDQEGSRVTRLQ